jgi:hypothetical protein
MAPSPAGSDDALAAAVPAFLTRAYPEFLAESWRAWRVVFYLMFGRADLLEEQDVALFTRCTGRTVTPRAAREWWFIVGRRGGKTRAMALIGVFLAAVKRYRLAPGERGLVMLFAADRRQARVLKRYVRGLLDQVPAFAAMVTNHTADSIELSNGITLEIHTSSFRAVRGYTVVAALCDEIAFWPTGEEAANPDAEILAAVRPAMATVPGALLLCFSSPYARRGELWTAYERHFGQDDSDVIVWQADTRTMNPSVDPRVIEAAYRDDAIAAAAEYGAEFRRDVEKFVSREVIDSVTVDDRFELRPDPRRSYVAFVDPSGGAHDSMTLAIAFRDDHGRAVLAHLAERTPPFSPEAVVDDFSATLRAYRVASVTGDRYAGEWARERFRKRGIAYHLSPDTKSELYVSLLPLLTSGACELLDSPRLFLQLLNLERRTTRHGRDLIDHPPRGADDVANAAAGALVRAGRGTADSFGVARIDHLL